MGVRRRQWIESAAKGERSLAEGFHLFLGMSCFGSKAYAGIALGFWLLRGALLKMESRWRSEEDAEQALRAMGGIPHDGKSFAEVADTWRSRFQ